MALTMEVLMTTATAAVVTAASAAEGPQNFAALPSCNDAGLCIRNPAARSSPRTLQDALEPFAIRTHGAEW